MAAYPKLEDLELQNKRVFIRVDFNVPLKEEGGHLVVADDSRIRAALPTIRYVQEQGARVILGSHLGRPKGKKDPKCSMEPVGACLSELLGSDVVLADESIGDGPRGLSQQIRPGSVLLLENLRFHSGEERNAPEFANDLAQLCDVYVADAFGTVHRAHASTDGLPRLKEKKAIGFLIEQEVRHLEPLRDDPPRPFGLIMGGAKVSDKIGILHRFVDIADKIFIGGAMAYAFLRAQGVETGTSLCDNEQVKLADRLLKKISARPVTLYLPSDHVVSTAFGNGADAKTTQGQEIPKGWMGLDIGPKTASLYGDRLQGLETVFWNGPMGVFETPAFSHGTFELARRVASCKATKLAGGGDVAAALAMAKVKDQFDFVSTGGGATLEYLEGKNLPGLAALEKSKRQVELEAMPPLPDEEEDG